MSSLGRLSISYLPAYHSYSVAIPAITIYSDNSYIECKVEADTLHNATIDLFNLVSSSEKVIFGRFTKEEKEVSFSFALKNISTH